jgi:hypothetical protein
MYLVDSQSPPPAEGKAVALNNSVTSGQVTLDPATGEDLRKTLREQIDQVDSWLERAGRLARPAPLGANPVGQAMTYKFEHRADGEVHSFVSVMTAYRTVLEQTHEAVSTAIRNYHQVDADASTDITKHG